MHARSGEGCKSPLTKRHILSSQFWPPNEFVPKLQWKKKVMTSIFRALRILEFQEVLQG